MLKPMLKMLRRVLAGGPVDPDIVRVSREEAAVINAAVYLAQHGITVKDARPATLYDEVKSCVYDQITCSVWGQVNGFDTLTPEERRMLEMPDA